MILLKKRWNEYKHFLLLSLYGLLYIWFYYLEKTVVPKYDMFSPMDMKIPFIKEFVIPYLFWYIYMAFGFIYLGIVSKKDYYRLFLFMFFGMVICYAIYGIFPNGQSLRPVITENDIFSRIMKGIYAADTPTNVAPSIHVLNSIAIHVGLIGYEPFKKNMALRITSFILMIIISASTVLVKQHSILDGIWAIALSMVLYVAIYLVPDLVAGRQKAARREKNTSISM
ncbi:phosphatase PAP2 family protein [Alkaliphilus sp. B6464]|uniref:phosphatase PAP2 family protein n=1 Tax=Alkaliphilus sp. B6464 TaxID=2731219 RepID=UPI001BAE3FC9|nr:phosphatase PAP2 family protein [Alkaliphilus sp. B6464]QUH20295.1 phosphatidic acid phosphatase [Alkaliphilus sp. B6464]